MFENGIVYGLIIAVVISILVFLIPFLYERFRYYRFYRKCTVEFVDSLIQTDYCSIYDVASYFGVDYSTARLHILRLGFCLKGNIFIYRSIER